MSASSKRTTAENLLVAPFRYFSRADLERVGGKGANLAELTQAGFQVPPGFLITTNAYRAFVETNQLQAQIASLVRQTRSDDPAALEETSTQIRALFEKGALPETSAAEIKDAYLTLIPAQPHTAPPVAVRSSATAEDLPGFAFAGQQETYLNVMGAEAVLEAVKKCWSSLWTARAIGYRARNNIPSEGLALAVVVQHMIASESSGVLFTANPVTGKRAEMVMDASFGLGEAIVSGQVQPDHYVVDTRRWQITQKKLGAKSFAIVPRAEGDTQSRQRDAASEPALTDAQILELARVCERIARHFGAPQDIEWAWVSSVSKAGQFFILQARPMTALPEPLKITAPMRRIAPLIAEMFPVRPYPLDVTTFTGALERLMGGLLVMLLGKGAPALDKTFVEEEGVVAHFEMPEFRPSPSMLVAPLLSLWRARHYDPSRWEADPLLAEVLTRARDLEARDLRVLTWAQNMETLHQALALLSSAMELRQRYIPKALLAVGVLWLLLALARRGDCFGALVVGVETKTTETNRALESLATQIRSDPTLRDLFAQTETYPLQSALQQSEPGRAFLRNFAAFLAQYGHRETGLTISQPAWKDQPEVVLGMLKVLAATESQEADSYRVWKRTCDELLAHSILGAPLLRNLFLKALTQARCFFQMREDTHFYATLAQPPMRRVALELGRRLEQVGALGTATDVFHLRLDELESLGEPWPPSEKTLGQVHALVAQRKTKREALATKPIVDPRLLAIEAHGRVGENVILSGSAGSPGIVSGPARIVHDVSEFGKLQPGDVLIAPVTNPAWTPLFQRAVAVVVDTGGLASHAAIVAREYGVPAVMGTLNGTQQLRDGQWIQVDGNRGLVLKAEEPT